MRKDKRSRVRCFLLGSPSFNHHRAAAVTLEGTIIHKSGLITGGKSTHNNGKKWDEKDVQGRDEVFSCPHTGCLRHAIYRVDTRQGSVTGPAARPEQTEAPRKDRRYSHGRHWPDRIRHHPCKRRPCVYLGIAVAPSYICLERLQTPPDGHPGRAKAHREGAEKECP